MKEKLLEYLACPGCQDTFRLTVSGRSGEEIMEGTLTCRSCGKSYGIVRGVPRVLPPEISADKKATARAFGYEWKHFTSLTDKYKAQFLDWIHPVLPDFFQGKTVLDAGCGKGRHVYLAAQFGARDVIGVDLSEAVDVAFANTKHLSNAHIVQADLYHLPFRAPFDYIYSIGVLHHLPSPQQGFLSLVKHMAPGGRISIWVYGKEGNRWITKIVNPIRIHLTSKMPRAATMTAAFLLTCILQPLVKCVYQPINRHRFLSFLKPFLFYNAYLYSISDFSFRENYSIVFDHLVAPTAFYVSHDEVSDWFRHAGLMQSNITPRYGNSWRGTGMLQ